MRNVNQRAKEILALAAEREASRQRINLGHLPASHPSRRERLPLNSQISDNLRGGRVVKQVKREIKIERPRREVVDRETALKRVKAFPKRQEKLIAAIRKGTR